MLVSCNINYINIIMTKYFHILLNVSCSVKLISNYFKIRLPQSSVAPSVREKENLFGWGGSNASDYLG